MKVKAIYKKLGIIPNLAEHMVTVARVALLIKNHWQGPKLDWEMVKKTALLHDLGNIVRFDLDKYSHFLGLEAVRIDYWKGVQMKTIAKYGKDDHQATKKMLDELGTDQKIIKVILNKSFGGSVQLARNNDWPAKILHYADARVMPHGVVTLEERIQDTRERMPKYANRPDFEDLVAATREIEKQIQEKLDIAVSAINQDSVKKIKENLLETEI
jgi:hypothetical protein